MAIWTTDDELYTLSNAPQNISLSASFETTQTSRPGWGSLIPPTNS
jgi:hypothetical protein